MVLYYNISLFVTFFFIAPIIFTVSIVSQFPVVVENHVSLSDYYWGNPSWRRFCLCQTLYHTAHYIFIQGSPSIVEIKYPCYIHAPGFATLWRRELPVTNVLLWHGLCLKQESLSHSIELANTLRISALSGSFFYVILLSVAFLFFSAECWRVSAIPKTHKKT